MAFLIAGRPASGPLTLPAWIRPQRTTRGMGAPCSRKGHYAPGPGGAGSLVPSAGARGSDPDVTERVDVAVVGAGAAGLMAAIQARRAHPRHRVRLLDGARTLGAKILVSGGARCNVTHHEVDETAFAGSSPKAIRKVLRRFGVAETVAFFRDLGVVLKKEETGKLFPSTDRARTVLDALLGAAREAGVEIRHPWRVTGIES